MAKTNTTARGRRKKTGTARAAEGGNVIPFPIAKSEPPPSKDSAAAEFCVLFKYHDDGSASFRLMGAGDIDKRVAGQVMMRSAVAMLEGLDHG